MLNGKWNIIKKINIIDAFVILAITALLAGYLYRQNSPRLAHIVHPNQVFYITLETPPVRQFTIDAINIGDVMFPMHHRSSAGNVVNIDIRPAMGILKRSDGTTTLAYMEQRYIMQVTLRTTGSITNAGYLVDGILHVSPGSGFPLVSNTALLPGQVISIDVERP